MGSTSIDWDTVQVVKDPKKKQVEVGFKGKQYAGLLPEHGSDPKGPGPDWDPNPEHPDNGGPEPETPSQPIPPEDDQFPECDPQDCNALTAFDTQYPSSGYALFYSSATFDTLTNAVLRPNGWAKLNVAQNPPTDTNIPLSTTLREAGITSGPCDTAKLYGNPIISGGASNIRNVPAGTEAVWNQTGITQEAAQGSMGCYLWGRDSNGNRKNCRMNLVVSRAFAWKGTGYATGTSDTTIAIDVVAESGGVFLEYTGTGERVKVGTGNDLTGAYFVSWENTWSINASGDASVVSTATVTAKAGGALSITRTGSDITGDWEPGTTLNMPRNTDRGAYTCYFEASTNNPLLLAAFSVSDTQSIQEAEDFIKALERSQQEYTTPPYCSRIP